MKELEKRKKKREKERTKERLKGKIAARYIDLRCVWRTVTDLTLHSDSLQAACGLLTWKFLRNARSLLQF